MELQIKSMLGKNSTLFNPRADDEFRLRDSWRHYGVNRGARTTRYLGCDDCNGQLA